jgi:RNA-directed DNA polymerase
LRKTPISLQDLRRSLYVKAKAEPSWRFWGLYIHICKLETLREAYQVAKTNDGAPGIDGVTLDDIEGGGREEFLRQIQEELVNRTYRPMRVRKKEIPKDGGKVRVLAIPCIRDRVVQGAMKLILEPVFEADFQPGSYGYRPKRTAQQAVHRVAEAIAKAKTRVIDVDLRAYFDNVRHHLLLEKMARRIQDGDVLHLLKMILKATGKQGVPQGGVISPLISNVYLNEVDRMLEKAIEVTRYGKERQYTVVQYARFADDLVILIHAHRWNDWVVRAVEKRLREEFGKLRVEINEEKSRTVDISNGERFSFLGFEYRRVLGSNGVWRPLCTPKLKRRKALTQKLKEIFRRYISAPTGKVIERINPILRGWVNYFAVGNSSRCFSFVKSWVEKKIRRHLMRAQKRKGFGWKRWSSAYLYEQLGLFDEYRVRHPQAVSKALPA